jgi:hypothetical protein
MENAKLSGDATKFAPRLRGHLDDPVPESRQP